MMKNTLAIFAAFSALTLASAPMSFAEKAAGKHCSCTKKCMKQCAKGKGSKHCKCDACDCAKSGKCGEGEASCGHDHDHDHDHDAAKPSEPAKQ